MRVFVDWDTDGYSVEELGLTSVVDMPTMNVDDIADYLYPTSMDIVCHRSRLLTWIVDIGTGKKQMKD